MAALVRSGLDLDLVLNPFQMERLTTAEDRPAPELAQVISVRNPIHVEPKSLTVIRDPDDPEQRYALQFVHSSTVPSYFTIYFMALETPDEGGCPQFYPATNLESLFSQHQILLQPQIKQTVTVPIPDVVANSLTAPSRLPSHVLPFLASADVNPSFHHIVMVLEPIEALPKPNLQQASESRSRRNQPRQHQHNHDEDAPEESEAPSSPLAVPLVQRARGFCTAEWLYIRLQPVSGQGNSQGHVQSSQAHGSSQPPSRPRVASPASQTSQTVQTSEPNEQELRVIAVHSGSANGEQVTSGDAYVQQKEPPTQPSPVEGNETRTATNGCQIGIRSVRQSVLADRALYDLHEIFGLDAARASEEAKAGSASAEQAMVTRVPAPSLDNRHIKLEWSPEAAREALLPVVPDCVICLSEASDCVNLPCRHMCVCLACAQRLIRQPTDQAKCPICRERLVSVTQLETAVTESH